MCQQNQGRREPWEKAAMGTRTPRALWELGTRLRPAGEDAAVTRAQRGDPAMSGYRGAHRKSLCEPRHGALRQNRPNGRTNTLQVRRWNLGAKPQGARKTGIAPTQATQKTKALIYCRIRKQKKNAIRFPYWCRNNSSLHNPSRTGGEHGLMR